MKGSLPAASAPSQAALLGANVKSSEFQYGPQASQPFSPGDGLRCKHVRGFIPLARLRVVRVKGKGQGAGFDD